MFDKIVNLINNNCKLIILILLIIIIVLAILIKYKKEHLVTIKSTNPTKPTVNTTTTTTALCPIGCNCKLCFGNNNKAIRVSKRSVKDCCNKYKPWRIAIGLD